MGINSTALEGAMVSRGKLNGTFGAMIGAGALLISGCTVGPDYKAPPKMPVPSAWVGGPTTVPTSQASITTPQAVQIIQWWKTFNDPLLDTLVKQAIESNLDLRQAESRLRQARAQRGIAAAGFWPSVDANGSYTHSRAGGGASQRGIVPASDVFQAGLDASWELDIFGGERRNIEAAEADIQAAVEDKRDVLVTLVSEVALSYLDLRGFQQQIAIARGNVVDQQRTADVTHKKQSVGFVSKLDTANADAEVATTLSQIPPLENAAQQSIYALSVLLAREPGALLQELSPASVIPTTPPEVPVGLPSDLLRRRPDIRRAEAQYHAATARIGVATADLFPQFSLTGAGGLSGNKFSSLGNWGNRFYSAGPGVTWNIFDAGAIRSNIEVQKELTTQTGLTYKKTVLTALQDVENALVAYAKEQEHRRALVDAVTFNRTAVEVATALYNAGQTDFLNLLTAQNALYGAQNSLVLSNHDLAIDLVSLYKALGGGWEAEEPGKSTTRPVESAQGHNYR